MQNSYEVMDAHFAADESCLKAVRKKRGLTPEALANASGVPVNTICAYERKGKDWNKAQADIIMRLTKALRCEISDLLGSLYRKNIIKSPKTGDTSNLVLWVALLLVSSTAIGAAVVGRKRIQQIIK